MCLDIMPLIKLNIINYLLLRKLPTIILYILLLTITKNIVVNLLYD